MTSIEELFAAGPYGLADDAKQPLLLDAILTELGHHYEHSAPYRRWCDARRFDPGHFSGRLADLPAVPVSVFKLLGPSLVSVPDGDVRFRLHSSATSGVPSTVLVDKVTAKRQAVAMAKVMADYLGTCRRPFVVFDVDPAGPHRAAIGARRAATLAYLRFSSSAHFVIDADRDGNLRLNEERLAEAIGSLAGSPAVAFGFTYVLFAEVGRLRSVGAELTLPAGSTVLHIGGWKQLESERVTRTAFADVIGTAFGVAADRVIDVYGFTEQMGLNYPDCAEGWKHVPVFAEVQVLDPATRAPLADGTSGLMSFATPIPHSYPGNVVVTDDLGVVDARPCPCGRLGRRFRIVGRVQAADVRGCGDVMATRVISVVDRTARRLDTGEFAVLRSRIDPPPDAPDRVRLDALIDGVRGGQARLAEYSVDDIIGLISAARLRWQAAAGASPVPGLAFLVEWCEPNRLRRLADFSLFGRRGHLDGFRPIPDVPGQMMRAHPRGLVAHWLSGNVPVLGMLTLVQSLLVKNANLLKASSDVPMAVPVLLDAFEGLAFTSPGGRSIEGNVLLDAVAVVAFDRTRTDLASQLSEAADVRLAWGGAEAVEAVVGLPRRPATTDLVFGPKLSYMAIGADALSTPRAVKKLARRAATDASVFEQTACASPHTIFVERGGDVEPEEFAGLLAEEMRKAARRLPAPPMSAEAEHAVHAARAVHEFVGTVWGDDTAEWTVLYDEGSGLATPTYSRVITVRPVDDVLEAAEFASPEIQTVGLALGGGRRQAFAERATRRGAERCPEIGSMTHFDTPWDGVVAMNEMVRWVTVGGPR